jgi:hypothetical protein
MTGSIKTYEYLIPFLTVYLALNDWDDYKRVIKITIFSVSVILMLFWSLPELYMRISVQKEIANPDKDFEASEWLSVNTEKGDLALLSWGDFPKFFYTNDQDRFLFGLNPVYCYGYDKEKYHAIRNFFDGDFTDPESVIKYLKAKYAVLNKMENRKTIDILKNKFLLVFQNEKYAIYKLY